MSRKPTRDKPAKKSDNQTETLTPYLPGNAVIGPLKDLAQEIIAASAQLEGKVADETALALGDKLRLINSYHSNLIEGHKTTIADIEMALQRKYHQDPEKKYAQELCAAHVQTEKQFMQRMDEPVKNVCDPSVLSKIHRAFYSHLPPEHLFTHSGEGFTTWPVNPGEFRDVNVSVDGRSLHGPNHSELPKLLRTFAQKYDPDRYHGDERLIAMAAGHHRLTWLHPFRDGNGRVARLFSGLYLSRININKGNLWSLSRGLSRNSKQYMFELWSADSPNTNQSGHHFDEHQLVDFCRFFFGICLDQIGFMQDMLRLDQIESRIDWYVQTRSKQSQKPLHPESAKILRAVFTRGKISRDDAAPILNTSARSARRIVSTLVGDKLLESKSHRAPLTIGLPLHVLPYYFPGLYDPTVIGET